MTDKFHLLLEALKLREPELTNTNHYLVGEKSTFVGEQREELKELFIGELKKELKIK